jgi:hypothetical protein
MKTFIYWNVQAHKSHTEIRSLMNKEANGEPYKFAIVPSISKYIFLIVIIVITSFLYLMTYYNIFCHDCQ